MVVWPKPCKSRSSPGALPQNPRPSAGVFLCPDNTPGNTPSRKPAIPANTRPRPPPTTPATRPGERGADRYRPGQGRPGQARPGCRRVTTPPAAELRSTRQGPIPPGRALARVPGLAAGAAAADLHGLRAGPVVHLRQPIQPSRSPAPDRPDTAATSRRKAAARVRSAPGRRQHCSPGNMRFRACLPNCAAAIIPRLQGTPSSTN